MLQSFFHKHWDNYGNAMRKLLLRKVYCLNIALDTFISIKYVFFYKLG